MGEDVLSLEAGGDSEGQCDGRHAVSFPHQGFTKVKTSSPGSPVMESCVGMSTGNAGPS